MEVVDGDIHVAYGTPSGIRLWYLDPYDLEFYEYNNSISGVGSVNSVKFVTVPDPFHYSGISTHLVVSDDNFVSVYPYSYDYSEFSPSSLITESASAGVVFVDENYDTWLVTASGYNAGFQVFKWTPAATSGGLGSYGAAITVGDTVPSTNPTILSVGMINEELYLYVNDASFGSIPMGGSIVKWHNPEVDASRFVSYWNGTGRLTSQVLPFSVRTSRVLLTLFTLRININMAVSQS
jgi:hypothetical protein